jgi:DtxR family Mn-dependent transcriptional regulator
MPWDLVHDEAEVLEHYISEDLERRIAERLGNPAIDPHGDPIPSSELSVEADQTIPLSEIPSGTPARFARVSDSDPGALRYLDELGIRPGLVLEVTGVEPFGGPVRVLAGGAERMLGEQLVEKIRVEPT